ELDLDVLAHPLDNLVGAKPTAVFRIQIQLVDNMQKTGTTKNLLGEVLHPRLQIFVHVRNDIILGHGWLLHQNQRARLVARRQNPARPPHCEPPQKQRDQEMQVAPANDSQVVLKVETLRSFRINVCGHGLSFKRPRELIRDRNKLLIDRRRGCPRSSFGTLLYPGISSLYSQMFTQWVPD